MYSRAPDLDRRAWGFNGGAVWRVSVPNFPRCDDWRTSLRRIVHNQDGTTVVEGDSAPLDSDPHGHDMIGGEP